MSSVVGAGSGGVRLLAALIVLCGAAGPLRAEVVLDYEVAKVTREVDENGRTVGRLVPAEHVREGDELRYTIAFTNVGDETLGPGRVVITSPLPIGTRYVAGSAFGAGTDILFSTDQGHVFASAADLSDETVDTPEGETSGSLKHVDTIRWIFNQPLGVARTSTVSFAVVLNE